MARIRTIKPEFWSHEDLSALPEATHMLAAALLNYADDEGYFNAHPGLIRAACCPLREPSVSIQDSLTNLSNVGFLRFGNGADGKRYGQIVTFSEHQRINRPTASKIKKIAIDWEASTTAHTQLTEPSHPERNREQGKEQGTGKGEDVPASPAPRASRGSRLPDEWQPSAALLAEGAVKWPGLDLAEQTDRFRDWAKAASGSVAVKRDWEAAWRNWMRKAFDDYAFRIPKAGGIEAAMAAAYEAD